MKALSITAQPKAEAAWVHRFRNFGEAVYVKLRASCAVDLEEIDGSFDEFHVTQLRDEDVAAAAQTVAALNREHSLHDSVFISISEAPVYHQTVMIVLDPTMGERLWEIAGRHPLWIVGSEVNRAAVKDFRDPDTPGQVDITVWSNEFDLVTEQDWQGILNTVDLHHGVYASDPPMNKLSIYGAAVTPPAIAVLREYGFEAVLPTASGFLALQEWL
ncbi:MAG: hypothetical protein QOH21_761 [Acidobacteriota bacterium]|jgi:hypothetical protein|nr:hypothetical protein [Acidobacteriota bacterium]